MRKLLVKKIAKLLKSGWLLMNFDEWIISRSTKLEKIWNRIGNNEEKGKIDLRKSLSIIIASISDSSVFWTVLNSIIDSNVLLFLLGNDLLNIIGN